MNSLLFVIAVLACVHFVQGATCSSGYSLSGHPLAAYNGEYKKMSDWAGKPSYRNSAGMHLFMYGNTQCDDGPAGSCWNLDPTDQSDANEVSDLYAGGYVSSKDALGTVQVLIPMSAVLKVTSTTATVSGHPMSKYNGVYTKEGDWGGKPHYRASNGAQLFCFNGETQCDSEDAGACWHFDMTDQSTADTVEDLYAGGYFSTQSIVLPSLTIQASLPFEITFACTSSITCDAARKSYKDSRCCGNPMSRFILK